MSRIIPHEFVQQLKDAASIRSIVAEFVPLKKSGRAWMGRCPFHDDKDPSFSVNDDRQIYYCFGCGEGGDVFKFLMKIRGLSFVEAVELVAERVGLEVPREPLSPDQQKKKEREELLAEVNGVAISFYHERLLFSPEGAEARDYLDKRGLTRQLIEEFQIGWAPDQWSALVDHLRAKNFDLELACDAGLLVKREKSGGWYDRFRGRIIFPILDRFGKPVALGGRVLGDGMPKYLNSPESSIYKKSKVLYGMYHSKGAIRRARRGFVVEGYMDYLAMVRMGIKEAVATLGTALTDDHVRLLKGLCREWVLVFDGDAAGLKAAKRAIPLFYAYDLRPKVIVLPEGDDPDSILGKKGIEEWQRLTDRAVSGLDFMIQLAISEFGDDAEGRYNAAKEILKLLKRVTDPIRKSLLVSHTAEALAIPERSIWESLKSAEEGGARPGQASKGRIRMAPRRKRDEEYVLGFLLNYPGYLPEFMDTNPELWLEGDDSRRVWEAVKNVVLSQATQYDSIVSIVESLTGVDDSIGKAVSRLREHCPPCEDADKVAESLLRYCRERHTKWLRQELIAKLKDGGGAEEELLKEYQQLL